MTIDFTKVLTEEHIDFQMTTTYGRQNSSTVDAPWNAPEYCHMGDNRYVKLQQQNRIELSKEEVAAILHSSKHHRFHNRAIPKCCEQYRVNDLPLGIAKAKQLDARAGRFIIPFYGKMDNQRDDLIRDSVRRHIHAVTVPLGQTFVVTAYVSETSVGNAEADIIKPGMGVKKKLSKMFYRRQAGAVEDHWECRNNRTGRQISCDIVNAIRSTKFPPAANVYSIPHEVLGIMSHYCNDVLLDRPWWPEREPTGI